MEETLVSFEVTPDETILETLRIVNVKHPFTPTTLIREWLNDGYYRSTFVPEVPETAAAAGALECKSKGEDPR